MYESYVFVMCDVTPTCVCLCVTYVLVFVTCDTTHSWHVTQIQLRARVLSQVCKYEPSAQHQHASAAARCPPRPHPPRQSILRWLRHPADSSHDRFLQRKWVMSHIPSAFNLKTSRTVMYSTAETRCNHRFLWREWFKSHLPWTPKPLKSEIVDYCND